jgi:acyl dehydratase
MLDRSFVGKITQSRWVDVEKNQLRFFARAVGEKNPIYTDEAVAKAAGYRSLPAPPTFLFSLSLPLDKPLGRFVEAGFDLETMLHGQQAFEYHRPICAGDHLLIETRVIDIFEKKNGALEFMIEQTTASDENGSLLASMRLTMISNNRRQG